MAWDPSIYGGTPTYFSATVDETGAEVLAANPARRYARVLNDDATSDKLSISDAVGGTFATLRVGMELIVYGTGAIYCKAPAGQTVLVNGYWV